VRKKEMVTVSFAPRNSAAASSVISSNKNEHLSVTGANLLCDFKKPYQAFVVTVTSKE
jgi:hypothetical protein